MNTEMRSDETKKEMPQLKRETVLPASDRGRTSLLFALCTMVGVALGFGLATVSLFTIKAPATRAMTIAPTPTPVSLSCSDGCTWLGIQMVMRAEGVEIVRVFDDSPAAHAGLTPGMFVLGIDGQVVRSPAQVVRTIRRYRPGHDVELVTSNGRAMVDLGWISGRAFGDL